MGPTTPKTATGRRAASDIAFVSVFPKKRTAVSAITATVASKNSLAAPRVTSHSSLYQVRIIGLIISPKGSSLAEMAAFEVVSCDSSVV